MSHEQSETRGSGERWRNVYGRGTPQSGLPLPPAFGFERNVYPDVKSAESAAALRSLFTREDERPYVPSSLPQVPLDFGAGLARPLRNARPGEPIALSGIALLLRLLGMGGQKQ